MAAVLLEARDLEVQVGGRRRLFGAAKPLKAVDCVSIRVEEGEILGLVGESGCGKTTLAKALLGLLTESAGEVTLAGVAVSGLKPRAARQARSDIQYVHQDAAAALDPWWRIGATLDETLRVAGVADEADRAARITAMMAAVGLSADMLHRYPHELSGGQLRRVTLARMLTLRPRLVILDEPTAGLDLSIQAAVLGLLRDLRAQFGLTYVLISHDLSVVRRMCDRVAIMYLGRIVEEGPAAAVFGGPRHPYTRALLEAAPRLDAATQLAALQPLKGDPPTLKAIPSGCAFRVRCPHAVEACAGVRPALEGLGPDHRAACIRLAEIGPATPAGAA